MNRSKIVAIITGAISLILAVGYLLLVQLLDFRGEMRPAPQSYLPAVSAPMAQAIRLPNRDEGQRTPTADYDF